MMTWNIARVRICLDVYKRQVLICTIADGIEDFENLRDALKQIRGANYHIANTFAQEEINEVYRTQLERSMRDAFFAERRIVAVEDLSLIHIFLSVKIRSY